MMIPDIRTRALLGVLLFLLSGPAAKAQETDHWETVILPGRQCQYLVPDSPVDPAWTSTGFDDSGWTSATGGVGYGDDDDNTIIAPAISVYCRYNFTLSSPEVISQLLLDMDFDDGFVAYLNGVELARYNMGEAGSVTAWDQASDAPQEALLYQGIAPLRFTLGESVSDLLLTVDNTFAVEVHNYNPGSSDLSSNPYLHAGVGVAGNYFHATPGWFYPPFTEDSTLLPLVLIDTDRQTIPNEPRITAQMKLIYNEAGLYNRTSDPGNGYDGQISIEIRGESSAWYSPKKSYSFETQTAAGENNNVSLLGLPAENDWVLYGPYLDKSLIRNVLSYRLFAEMGHYSPRTHFVEVVVNNDYQGLYILTEKIKRDINRVDIAKLLPEDVSGNELTGGYLLRIDKLTDLPETHFWESPVSPPYPDYLYITYQYFDPKYEELNESQRNYIRNYLVEFETIMTNKYFKDPARGYRAYLDIPSFVDMMILNEFTKDVDAFRLSHYFYKEKDSDGGKLVSGPPWDYNLTFGNSDFTEDMHQSYNWIHTYPITIYWWARAMEDSWFRNKLRCRWDELHQTILSSEHLHSMIDSAIQVMGDAIPNNFRKWPILGTYVWPNSYVGQTYSDEEWLLRNWIDERLEWMDARWGGQCWPLSDADEVIPLPEPGRVYPNPSDLSATFVDLDALVEGEIPFRLYDMNGRLVYQAVAPYSGREFAYALPDLSFLPNGIYTLETGGHDQKRAVFKVIKQ
ncbi:MAG: CotH kinase family protein [Bacteroidales bacterium]|nr:CotH kinase family protein [Bacteroidales bacterium]